MKKRFLRISLHQCSSGHAIKSLVELISEPPQKIAVLGPSCSLGAEPVANALKFWNLTQVRT